MATFHKGNGGAITAGGIVLPTIDAEITEEAETAELKNSGNTTPGAAAVTAGRVRYIGTWISASFHCTVVFDSAALLVATLEPSLSVTVQGNLGDSGKSYSGTAVITKLRHYWNNRQGVVEAELAGNYTGGLTDPA